MNTPSYFQKVGEIKRQWYEIDAAKYPLGRLATRAATVLRGKHKPTFTPSMDGGDFVVVVNAKNMKLTGRKEVQKTYFSYSGYPGGLKRKSLAQVLAKSPRKVIEHAVRNMLATNRLRRQIMRRLKIVDDDKHTYKIDKKL